MTFDPPHARTGRGGGLPLPWALGVHGLGAVLACALLRLGHPEPPAPRDAWTGPVLGELLVRPATATLRTGERLTLQVSGEALASQGALRFSVDEGGGRFEPGGVYVAPKSAGVYRITVRTPDGPVRVGHANVTVKDVLGGLTPLGALRTPGHDTWPVPLDEDHLLLLPEREGAPPGAVPLVLDLRQGTSRPMPFRAFHPGDGVATPLPGGRIFLGGGEGGLRPALLAPLQEGGLLLPWAGRPLPSRPALFRAPEGQIYLAGGTRGGVPTGEVALLVAGGLDRAGAILGSTEVHFPTQGSLFPSASLLQKRWGHTATLLPNGNVVLAGGLDDHHQALDTLEIYHIKGDFFTQAGLLRAPRAHAKALLLPGGNLLLAGGRDGAGRPMDTVEIVDLATHKSALLPFPEAGAAPVTAVLLPGGRVVVLSRRPGHGLYTLE